MLYPRLQCHRGEMPLPRDGGREAHSHRLMWWAFFLFLFSPTREIEKHRSGVEEIPRVEPPVNKCFQLFQLFPITLVFSYFSSPSTPTNNDANYNRGDPLSQDFSTCASVNLFNLFLSAASLPCVGQGLFSDRAGAGEGSLWFCFCKECHWPQCWHKCDGRSGERLQDQCHLGGGDFSWARSPGGATTHAIHTYVRISIYFPLWVLQGVN